MASSFFHITERFTHTKRVFRAFQLARAMPVVIFDCFAHLTNKLFIRIHINSHCNSSNLFRSNQSLRWNSSLRSFEYVLSGVKKPTILW